MYPFGSNSSLYNNRLYQRQSNLDLVLNGDEQVPSETSHLLQNPNPAPIVPKYFQPSSINLMNTYPVHYNHPNSTNYPNNLMHEGLIYRQAPEQYLNYQVQQPELQPQVVQQPVPRRPQRLEMQIENGEEVLNLQLERPFMPRGKPRLRWTWDLHSRFLLAAMELGGIFSATPRGILERMNVRGVTVDHIKSHLQKVRLHNNIDARRNSRTNNQAHVEEQPGLLGTNEAQDTRQNLEIEPDNYFNYADFDSQTS